MKKLLSTIMALVMLLSLVPMAVAEEGEGTENVAVQSNDVYEVTDAAQLIWAAENHTGSTIKLMEDVTVSSPVVIPAGKEFTLDLGGKTLTNNRSTRNGGTAITNNGTLTIVNGTIKSEMNNGIVARSNSKTTIEPGVTVEAQECAVGIVDATGAEIIINGGKFTTVDNSVVSSNGSDRQGEANKITINGGTFTGNIKSSGYVACGIYAPWKDIITVNDGTFIVNNGIGVVCRAGQVYINGGTFICNGSAKGKVGDKNFDMDAAQALYFDNSIPPYPGYTADTDGIFVNGGAFTDLASAVKYATNGATITLAGDAKGDVVIPAGKTITLDLGGHKLTNVSGNTITNEGTLTITGTGTVDNVTNDKAALVNYGTAALNGGNFTRSKENPENNKNNGGGNSYYTILNDKGATMTINEGVTVSNVGHFSSMIRNGGDGNTAAVSTMTINGGTFSGGINTVKNDENGVLTINGGDFSNTSQVVIMNWNKAAISDGTFEANASAEAVLFTAKYLESRAVGELKIEGGMYVCAANQKLIVDRYNNDDQYLGTAVISAGAFNVAPDAKYLAEGMIVVPGVKDAPYSVQPAKRTNEEENTETEVKVDGDNVTVTVTDKTTGTTTETVTDTTTGAETVTKTETNVDTGVKTETVTEKNAAGETTKVTESKIVENTENGKTETKTTVDGKTVKTDVTVNQAPATASDVTLNAKALEGKAAGTETSSVTVDKASLSELKNNTVKGVIIETDQATLKLDKTAVKTMESKVEDNDKMTLDITVTEEKNATTTEIEKVKVEVTAKNEAGENVFPENTANTNGLINITIPYNGNAKYLDLWYIAANASATYMGRFPVVNGFVSFDVKHFSQYDLIPVASSGSSVIKTGAGSSAASTTQTVTTDLTPGSITKVTVDGKVVDAKYYTVSGSNVTFTAEFLKTLKNGSHTVTVENATKIAKGVFTVNNPTTAQSPTTADAGIALYAGMAIASVMGTGVVFTSRKRKNH